MGFSRQEYWSGSLLPTPGDLPNPGIEPMFPASPTLADEFFTTETPKIPNFSYKDIWHSMHHYFIFLHKSEYIYKFGGKTETVMRWMYSPDSTC